jgi:broad specificity phosphatase PhoE
VSAVGRIVCGPEQVVTESAQIASREFGVRYEVDRSLADVRIGRERDTKKHANLLMRWWSDPDFVAPRGESLNEVRRRISTTMNSLASRNAGDSLAIIVSPAIEIVVRFLVFGGNPTIHDWLGCGYASCTAYEYLEGGWSLVMPSDNSYLSEPITVGDSLPVELRRELERV